MEALATAVGTSPNVVGAALHANVVTEVHSLCLKEITYFLYIYNVRQRLAPLRVRELPKSARFNESVLGLLSLMEQIDRHAPRLSLLIFPVFLPLGRMYGGDKEKPPFAISVLKCYEFLKAQSQLLCCCCCCCSVDVVALQLINTPFNIVNWQRNSTPGHQYTRQRGEIRLSNFQNRILESYCCYYYQELMQLKLVSFALVLQTVCAKLYGFSLKTLHNR